MADDEAERASEPNGEGPGELLASAAGNTLAVAQEALGSAGPKAVAGATALLGQLLIEVIPVLEAEIRVLRQLNGGGIDRHLSERMKCLRHVLGTQAEQLSRVIDTQRRRGPILSMVVRAIVVTLDQVLDAAANLTSVSRDTPLEVRRELGAAVGAEAALVKRELVLVTLPDHSATEGHVFRSYNWRPPLLIGVEKLLG